MNTTPSTPETPDREPADGAPGPERDEAFARLRAADPARSLDPDLASLRTAVDARIAGAAGSRAEGKDDLAERRARRRWPAVVAVAASAVLVGGLGFGLGRLGGVPPADGVIVLSEGPADAAAAAPVATGVGEELAAAGDERLSIFPPIPWRTVFSASGLSDATGTAVAWAFDPAAAFTAESAERAARALGLDGEASLVYGAWTVGSQDGTGPALSVQPDGTASVSYYDPTRDPYVCLRAGAAGDATGRVPCADEDAGPAPSGAEAAGLMRDLMVTLGIEASVEIETSELDVPEAGQPRMTSVTAYQVLDGQRTGASWTAMFVGNGVQSFYGPLAPVVSLGEYDVVSENEAVRRLGDPRFGASSNVVWPLAAEAADARAGGMDAGVATEAAPPDAPVVQSESPVPSESPTIPPAPAPGAPIPWPVTQVTITQARLGLTMQWLPDGATALLPAYELTDADGASWSVLAVAEEDLDFNPDSSPE